MRARLLILPILISAACASTQIEEPPVLRPGDRVPTSDDVVDAVRRDAAATQRETAAQRDAVAAAAMATCTPDICAALSRGEVALGMSEAQVLAATRTTEGSWSTRDAGEATIMVPATRTAAPRDASGELRMIQLRNGMVTTYSYAESQGVRVVANPVDATTAGRASALADMLVREGDDYAARGQFELALNRYDRAQILQPNDPANDYRIATVLDKSLRPIEALVRYQLFLHRLELEKIEATGDAYAKLADAIARARERVIILEKETR